MLLEKKVPLFSKSRNRYGGLCDNFEVNGFLFDYAVHLSFTENKRVREIFDRTPYYTHKPIAYNYYYNYWLKHPIQNNLFCLPIEEKIKAIEDFVNKKNNKKMAKNYEEWIYEKYGTYIARNFFERYTKKYWTLEPKKMEVDWISNRLYRPELKDVLFGCFTEETPNTYYAIEMRYPVIGGYKSFIEPILENAISFLINKLS